MESYIIKIIDSTGIEHHHLIEDENDLQILKAVLKRVEKLATQKVSELSNDYTKPIYCVKKPKPPK